jgi:putative ABC transport system permease protein
MISFTLPWQVLAAAGGVVIGIVAISAAISLRKVMKLEPGMVFRG